MLENCKVSVVVPNYNHARFLTMRIETILRQTYQDFELILLDDCSADESREILGRYANDPRVRIEFNKVNSGSTFKQWNKGVRMARGKYVWIAESDDYADERLLERLVGILERDPEIAFASCRSWSVSETDELAGYAESHLNGLDPQHWRTDFCVDGKEECGKYFAFTNPVPNASAVVFRKACYQRVGGADETFRVSGDWKFWAAMALTGKIAYTAEPLNYFRSHSASVSQRSMSDWSHVAEHLRVVRWILGRVEVPEATLAGIRERKSDLWIPALSTLRVPLSDKLSILRSARAIDPNVFRRLYRPMVIAFRLKLRRELLGIPAGKSADERKMRG